MSNWSGNESWNHGGPNPVYPRYVPYHAPMRHWTIHNWGAFMIGALPVVLTFGVLWLLLKAICEPVFWQIIGVVLLVIFAIATVPLLPVGAIGVACWRYGSPFRPDLSYEWPDLLIGVVLLIPAVLLAILECCCAILNWMSDNNGH